MSMTSQDTEQCLRLPIQSNLSVLFFIVYYNYTHSTYHTKGNWNDSKNP